MLQPTEITNHHVETLTHGTYRLIGIPPRTRQQILIEHLACGGRMAISVSEFFDSPHQLFCSCQKQARAEYRFKQKLEQKYPNAYELVQPFTGAHDRILFKHKACGRIRPYRPSDLLYRPVQCQCERTAKRLSSMLEDK